MEAVEKFLKDRKIVYKKSHLGEIYYKIGNEELSFFSAIRYLPEEDKFIFQFALKVESELTEKDLYWIASKYSTFLGNSISAQIDSGNTLYVTIPTIGVTEDILERNLMDSPYCIFKDFLNIIKDAEEVGVVRAISMFVLVLMTKQVLLEKEAKSNPLSPQTPPTEITSEDADKMIAEWEKNNKQ